MSIQERIKKVRTDSGLTQEEFSSSIGLKRDNLAQLERGKQLPTLDTIQKVVKIYHISYEWLIEGKGKSNLTPSNEPKGLEMGKESGKERGKASVSEPLASYTIHNKENYALGGGNTHIVDTTGLKIIPVVDIKAAAGTGYINTDSLDQTQVIRLPATMIKSGYHLCIRVKGPSMAPTFQDGGYLIIRLLERSEWLNMRNEFVYVVVDTEGKTYVKRVKNRFSGENGGFIVCMSDNPDKTSHPNFNLHPDEIQCIWYAEWYWTARMPNIHDQYYSRLSNLEDTVHEIKEQFRKVQSQLK